MTQNAKHVAMSEDRVAMLQIKLGTYELISIVYNTVQHSYISCTFKNKRQKESSNLSWSD